MKALWNALKELLGLLPRDARTFLVQYSISSSALALLDVIALGLLAMVLAPMASGTAVSLPLIGTVGSDMVVWVLVAACGLLIVKSVIALLQQWYVTRRMAQFELVIGDRLFNAYIRAPWLERLKRNSAELVRMADVGIANTTSGLILPVASLPSQVVTFFAVLAVLFVAQPAIAIVTVVYLLIIAAILYGWVSRRAVVNGRRNRDYSFRTATLMTEMVQALKEITLRDKAAEVAAHVNENRSVAVLARATIGFLGAIPKFVLDSAMILGFLIIGGAGYLIGGAPGAFSAIALFGIASLRMVPSMLQFQAVMTSTASTLPHARAVIRDIKAAEIVRCRGRTDRVRASFGQRHRAGLRRCSLHIPGIPGTCAAGYRADNSAWQPCGVRRGVRCREVDHGRPHSRSAHSHRGADPRRRDRPVGRPRHLARACGICPARCDSVRRDDRAEHRSDVER